MDEEAVLKTVGRETDLGTVRRCDSIPTASAIFWRNSRDGQGVGLKNQRYRFESYFLHSKNKGKYSVIGSGLDCKSDA